MISVIKLVDLTVAAIVGILDLTWLALYGTKFSNDHAYFLTHRKMYNLYPNSWIFIPKNG